MSEKTKLKYIKKKGYNYLFEEIESNKEIELKIWKDKEFKDKIQIGEIGFALVNANFINEWQSLEVPEKSLITKTKSKNDFMITIGNKDFILYEGLLHKAHEKGLKSLTITDSEVDFNQSACWCLVKAEFEDGSVFEGFGSGTQQNLKTMVKNNFVEMAHTRAKARALRDALDIGVCSFEELGE